jgi:hypothetical protein
MAQEPDVDDEADGDSEHALEDETAPVANHPAAAEAPLFKRWVIACLMVAAVAGAGALGWQFLVPGQWARPAPKLDMRYEASAVRLAAPQAVSPSEEYLTPEGDVVFITQDELRAVSQTAALSGSTARKLAVALAEREPTKRVELLFALINDVPATPDGDKQAMVLYRVVTSALAGTDAPTRDATKAKLDRMIGCRFVGPRLPPCPDRPSEVPMWTLAALAIAALTAGLFGLASAWAARRRARKEDEAATADAVGDEAEEGA